MYYMYIHVHVVIACVDINYQLCTIIVHNSHYIDYIYMMYMGKYVHVYVHVHVYMYMHISHYMVNT